MRIDIRTELRPDGWWEAIDLETYDCDCDENGFFPIAPVGSGVTEKNAVKDLIQQIFEERE